MKYLLEKHIFKQDVKAVEDLNAETKRLSVVSKNINRFCNVPHTLNHDNYR